MFQTIEKHKSSKNFVLIDGCYNFNDLKEF